MRFQRNCLVLAVLMGSSAAVFAAASKPMYKLTVKEINELRPQNITAEQIIELRKVVSGETSALIHNRQAARRFLIKHAGTLEAKLRAQGKNKEAKDLKRLAAEFSRERSPYSFGPKPAAGQLAIERERSPYSFGPKPAAEQLAIEHEQRLAIEHGDLAAQEEAMKAQLQGLLD